MGEGCEGMPQGTLKAVLDTSALYPLLKEFGGRASSLLTELMILDLTKYELGNILWKEHRRGLLEDWEDAVEQWSKIIEEMPMHSIDPKCLRDVERIAVERDITFYDASYIYVAETRKLKLITGDRDLLGKCGNSMPLDEFLGRPRTWNGEPAEA
ncbi:MAG: type II toxin-antitoxin system VapC family toxin [Candidatus Bathyarchaeia archaeon]